MSASSEKRNQFDCRICGRAGVRKVWEVGSFRVGKCRHCTGMFVTNPPTLEELEARYAKLADPAYYEDNREQLRYYYKKLAKIIRGLRPNGGRIFDVGCSRGWFLDAMEGWEGHGNELNRPEANEAKQRHGDKIVRGPFETCPHYETPFDVVTIQDVLDHFIDPVAIIRKANSMLSVGGLLVIKVHDYGCLWAKLMGKRFYAVIPPFHLTFFNNKSLKVLCEQNGFAVIKTCHLSQAITIPTIFYRLARGNRNSFFGRVYQLLEKSPARKISIRKNLHDIVTLFATKVAGIDGQIGPVSS